MADLIVIPARWGSTRLPGKPLIGIAGHTLLSRVLDVARRAACLCDDVAIIVATDDARVADHAVALGATVALTDPAIATGSGRALAAARQAAVPPEIVLNLQGDAPFTDPAVVAALLRRARAGDGDVFTPVVPLDWAALDEMRRHKQTVPFSGTTCVTGETGRALWFSKTILPAMRDEAGLRTRGPLSPVLRHIGLYAYRRDALEAFERLPAGTYEALEGLEQLRLLEQGLAVMTITVAPPAINMSGIDTHEDIALAERLIARHGDPRAAPWPA